MADQYYKDGYKFDEIVKANNLTNPDLLETGQVLTIPKVEVANNPSTQLASADTNVSPNAPNTEWGPKITGNTYTVQEGDWLSTIAGRTYGDIFAYDKLAKANNIPNPDLIEPGQVLTIPR
ncbi:LysM peptidoglycan-binding domain-containing protein [Candidatus Daviesbacteria bacterium]|nr:LysM peptidoglycan-binding domain-containing protein [Candidatus Daviesbacteria bacterium]